MFLKSFYVLCFLLCSSCQIIEYDYWHVPENVTWSEAFRWCLEMKGGIVSPQNPALDNYLRNFVLTSQVNESIWIGAKKFIDGWSWPFLNNPMDYTNFQSEGCVNDTTQENQCLVAIPASADGGPWGWCIRNCDADYQFICQFARYVTITSTTMSTTVRSTSISSTSAASTEWSTMSSTQTPSESLPTTTTVMSSTISTSTEVTSSLITNSTEITSTVYDKHTEENSDDSKGSRYSALCNLQGMSLLIFIIKQIL